MVNYRTEIRFLIRKGTIRILRKRKCDWLLGIEEWPAHVIGTEEPSPIVMEENFEGEKADRIFIFEDICEDAPESKIQSIPSLLRVKLFMAVMKVA